jgi:hypothetical protein
MVPTESCDQTSIPRPAYHRSLARGLHLDALTLVRPDASVGSVRVGGAAGPGTRACRCTWRTC